MLKKYTVPLLFTMFAFIFASMLVTATYSEGTYINVKPAISTVPVNETFTVEIEVSCVKSLYCYQFYLKWERFSSGGYKRNRRTLP